MPPTRRLDIVLDSVRRLQRMGATGNLVNLLQKQYPADLAQVFADLQERETPRPSGLEGTVDDQRALNAAPIQWVTERYVNSTTLVLVTI